MPTYLNGVNVRSLGVVIERVEGMLDAPARTIQTANVLGSLGDIALAAVYRPRILTLVGTLLGSSYADRVAKQDPIKALAVGKMSRITVDDGVAVRTILGALTEGPLTPIGPAMRTRGVALRWSFLCPVGAWSDADPTIRHCQTANVLYDCPVGGAPSRPIIEVFGGATNPAVHICDAAGNLVWQFRFATTLTTAQSIEMDRTTGRIWHWSSGVRTDGIGYLNTADRAAWAQLTLDPQHGAIGYGPQVRVTAGTMRVLWWKAWP